MTQKLNIIWHKSTLGKNKTSCHVCLGLTLTGNSFHTLSHCPMSGTLLKSVDDLISLIFVFYVINTSCKLMMERVEVTERQMQFVFCYSIII